MNALNICIGIISYLPDKDDIRKERILRLNNLIKTLDSTFELPIIIIAQNGKDGEIELSDNCVLVKHYDKLGITLARETLRQTFINETDYTNIICLDDDFEINSDPRYAKMYIRVIDSNKDNFIEYENFLMNLCVMPRDIYADTPYDVAIDAEAGTGFEDGIYMSYLQDKYPSRYRKVKDFKLSLHKRSELVNDKFSTGFRPNINKDTIDRKSRDIIKENKLRLRHR